jgi:F-type H+-transporting ATPase subunit b
MDNHPQDVSDAAVEARLDHADKAQTLADGHAEVHHEEPSALGLEPGAWVALAMVVLLGILIWKKVPRTITGGLDGSIARIRQQLDEAKALRAEAEALRAEYAKKIAGAEKDAAEMLAHAQHEAEAIVAKAESDATDMIARREKMAQDKIGAAERAAIDELRAQAADAATRAAGVLIARNHSAEGDKALVDETIAGL